MSCTSHSFRLFHFRIYRSKLSDLSAHVSGVSADVGPDRARCRCGAPLKMKLISPLVMDGGESSPRGRPAGRVSRPADARRRRGDSSVRSAGGRTDRLKPGPHSTRQR